MCKHCECGEPLTLDYGDVIKSAVIEYGHLVIDEVREGDLCEVERIEIDYCPICGRYLEISKLRRYVRPSVDDRSRE